MRVDAQAVTVDIDGARIVTDAAVSAAPGTVVGLIGPNGSGKSTLLRTIYRALRPTAGQIVVGDADVWELSARTVALRTAVVLQDDSPDFEFTVREVVELGRVPHRRALDRRSTDDRIAVDAALARVGADDLAERLIATLSGGERQRVYLARALAQQTPVLILDEPTNHLDILAQIELLDLLTELPATVLVALHDLNLAASYCDTVFVLAGGKVVGHGPPTEVLTPVLIADVYGVAAQVGVNPLNGRPVIHLGHALRRRGHTETELSTTPSA